MHLLFISAVKIFQLRPVGGAVVPHLKSFLQEVFASLQSISVLIRITPVPNKEHEGLKHSNEKLTHVCWLLMAPECLQLYLKGFLGDLLHCQPAIFCKELQGRNTNKTHVDSGQAGGALL